MEVGEEGVHGEAQCLVMLVDGAPGFGLAADLASDGTRGNRMWDGCEEWLEDLLAKDDQGGDRAETVVEHLVASGMARLLHELLGAKFPQVVSGLAPGVVAEGLPADFLDLGGQLPD